MSVCLAGDMSRPVNRPHLGDYESALREMTLDSASLTRGNGDRNEEGVKMPKPETEEQVQEDGVTPTIE